MLINKPTFIPAAIIAGTLLVLSCGSALASETGRCVPRSGTSDGTDFNFVYDRTITSPADNKTGLTPVVYAWDLGREYTAHCDSTSSGPSFYFKAAPIEGTPVGHASQWYILDNNIEYQTKIVVYEAETDSDKWSTVPFTDVPNHVAHGNLMDQATKFYTGSKGNVTLYIRRPFVGKHIIPSTILARVYGTTIPGSYAAKPMATVKMSGTVTVPQSCVINEGDVINVDFGTIAENNFITKGQPPKGLTKKRLDFSIKCSNISNGVAVSLEFNASSDTNDSTAVKTDNSDIAIRLADTSNNTISPQGGEIPVDFNYNDQTGTSAMQLFPINTTGNIPQSGKFNSQVNVTVDIR